MTRITLLSWLLVLISMCHGAASHVEKRQASNMPQQTDSPQPTDSVQQTDLSQQTDLAGQTDTAGLAPQPTDMSQQLNIPQQQVDSMPQPDMMQLVPVPLDMAEPGHTNEPQLRTWEMFFWGPDPADSVVNLTVTYGSDNQMVISEDRISSLLSSVACSSGHDMITYTFKDAASYEEIVKAWDWVNQQAFRSFIITVTDQGCQATPDGDGRQAYQVDGITWNEGDKQALLKVQAKTFIEATGASDTSGNSGNSWKMVIDTNGVTSAAQKRRKRLDKDFSINVGSNFAQNIYKGKGVSIDCTTCGTAGSLNFRFEYSPALIGDSTGSAELRTSGLGAIALITVSASGNAEPISKDFGSKTYTLPGGFEILGVAKFGPTLTLGINAQLTQLNIAGTATFGVTAYIPDSNARADLFNSKGSSIGGGRFVPRFVSIPPTLQVQANIQGQIGPQVVIAIEASLFDTGASAGLAIVAPALIANVQAGFNSQGGICGNPNIRKGFSFGLGVGAQLDYFGGLEPASKVPNRMNALATSINVYSTCVGVRKRAEATPTGEALPELLR